MLKQAQEVHMLSPRQKTYWIFAPARRMLWVRQKYHSVKLDQTGAVQHFAPSRACRQDIQ